MPRKPVQVVKVRGAVSRDGRGLYEYTGTITMRQGPWTSKKRRVDYLRPVDTTPLLHNGRKP